MVQDLSIPPFASLASRPGHERDFHVATQIRSGVGFVAAAMIVVAIAILNPSAPFAPMNKPERTAGEPGRNGEGIANREKKAKARASESDSIMKDFVKSTGQADPYDVNAPRMQQKQIKMH